MGVQNFLLMASSEAAASVAAAAEPAEEWNGFRFRGLDNIKLITLWALIEAGSPDDDFESRLDQVPRISERESGPWVDVVPDGMLSTLAEIASMEVEESAALASLWGQTEEFEGWEASDVQDLLCSIGDLADSAQLEGKMLLLWTSL